MLGPDGPTPTKEDIKILLPYLLIAVTFVAILVLIANVPPEVIGVIFSRVQ